MNKNKFQYGDIVRIIQYPPDHINAKAKVVGESIHDGYYLVSNMNMPFQGTLANVLFHYAELQRVIRK